MLKAGIHTTNYVETFIEVAPDCPATAAEEPPTRAGAMSVAALQYAMLAEAPYTYTSDDVLFAVYAERQGIPEAERAAAREQFFSRGQPCFRASPLTKRYGWGVHADESGHIALYARESAAYQSLAHDPALQHVQAMRSRRG